MGPVRPEIKAFYSTNWVDRSGEGIISLTCFRHVLRRIDSALYRSRYHRVIHVYCPHGQKSVLAVVYRREHDHLRLMGLAGRRRVNKTADRVRERSRRDAVDARLVACLYFCLDLVLDEEERSRYLSTWTSRTAQKRRSKAILLR
ncbi:uncharacterized protein BKA55DRAFT_1265 [Fusarium redolens]|uniref:Uncharacterized protein n=1 Tax=Fusarium redolens TaxID=48865 RepID=A0A9P9KV82_FUSRE|nr:uncharacterized protein BKA55DRAFT_1265 [Fusarium redolens]KAH7269074.1 hypothetical protein BKA55DRAFT_1265 [Fusarium redolens]